MGVRNSVAKKEGKKKQKKWILVLGTWLVSATPRLALSCLLACVVALWSTRKYYCMYFAALCRAD